MNEVHVMEVGNMSSLEEKVDTLIRYCIAESETARQFYQLDLCNLLRTDRSSQLGGDVAGCIDRALADLGVPDHLLGYGYLRSAIDIAVKDPETVHYVTGLLYPKVAKCHATSPELAERAIRHAIQSGWCRCGEGMREHYFGGKIKPGRAKPTNAEFIARLANIVRRQILK